MDVPLLETVSTRLDNVMSPLLAHHLCFLTITGISSISGFPTCLFLTCWDMRYEFGIFLQYTVRFNKSLLLVTFMDILAIYAMDLNNHLLSGKFSYKVCALQWFPSQVLTANSNNVEFTGDVRRAPKFWYLLHNKQHCMPSNCEARICLWSREWESGGLGS